MDFIDKNKNSHGWLHLSPDLHKINGLSFVSYVSSETNKEKKEKYFKKVLKEAKEKINNINHEKLVLEDVFDDIEIQLANKARYVSLRVGLWVLN
ncbi:hypothetical protein ES708_26158 [subsurface metagenome]